MRGEQCRAQAEDLITGLELGDCRAGGLDLPGKLGHPGPVADAWAVLREANQARRPTD